MENIKTTVKQRNVKSPSKRILLTTNIFPPAIGGPAVFGARLGEELARRGHEVTVLCATGEGEADNQHSYPFHLVRTGFSGNRIERELSLRARLLWAAYRTDLIYCMGLEHQTAWACRLLRKPYVLRVGGDYAWEAARNLGATDMEPIDFYKLDDKKGRGRVAIEEKRRSAELAGAKSVIYVSDYIKNLAGYWAEPRPDKEHVVRNGIMCKDAGQLPRRKDGEKLRLLFVGRQTNWKGVDATLLALSSLPDATLTVAGSGPALPGNVDLAKRLGITDRVQFIGNISPDKMISFMADHHVLLLPSLYEGLSNTLLEAGVAGLACIASAIDGNREVIKNNETGLLVAPFDIEGVVSAIKTMERNEEERIRLADNHRENVTANFNMEKTILETMRILEEDY